MGFKFPAAVLAASAFLVLSACGGNGSTNTEDDRYSEIDDEGGSEGSENNKGSSGTEKNNSSSSYSSSSDRYVTEYSSSIASADEVLNPEISYGELIDLRDGQKYKTVKIGVQNWMAQNLNVKTERCQQSRYVEGRLYEWPDAVGLDSSHNYDSFASEIQDSILPENHTGICPPGWHIPTVLEYKQLLTFVANKVGEEHVGTALKSKFPNAWPEEEDEERPTDEFGFSIVFVGYITDDLRYAGYSASTWFGDATENVFWSSLPDMGGYAFGLGVDKTSKATIGGYTRDAYLPVRCLENRDFDEGKTAAPQKGSVYDSLENTLTDLRDNKVYKTVVIGTQIWMAENLNYVTEGGYADDLDRSRCFGDMQFYCEDYGRLYRWSGAMDIPYVYAEKQYDDTLMHQGLCPQGWHLPTKAEFDTLISHTGGFNHAGKNLKSVDLWRNGAPLEDDYSFNAKPLSTYDEWERINNITDYATFWKTNNHADSADVLYISEGHDNVAEKPYLRSKYKFHAVRCLRNEPGFYVSHAVYDSYVDERDSKTYKTVKIGEDTWMAENLAYAGDSDLLAEESWCYEDDESNCKVYGRLYSWNAATLNGTKQGSCPEKWHVSTKDDWENLINAVGNDPSVGKLLKDPAFYKSGPMNKNDYGFSALGAGVVDTAYHGLETEAHFWTANAYNDSTAYYYSMAVGSKSVTKLVKDKKQGRSVRCVLDR
ncbi:major paralogous domain-containing protein [Fibrobacter sp. UWT2]|uniref:FISUMP domain-containing protein n=1 Tax=Fibrobacter sp. UWT2 TaxID=1896224 RepID=UPI0009117491|nr:FISUMP domain-containing protein [Fibrobacter sp. UWT2]SHL25627.1 major paralogous domain-containing protein [Fibrobacter sp. UWT2]